MGAGRTSPRWVCPSTSSSWAHACVRVCVYVCVCVCVCVCARRPGGCPVTTVRYHSQPSVSSCPGPPACLLLPCWYVMATSVSPSLVDIVTGTVEYDSQNSVVLRLRKRRGAADDAAVNAEPSTGASPTGSEVRVLVHSGSRMAHPARAALPRSVISSQIARIVARAEFRGVLLPGYWNARAQELLERSLLTLPRSKGAALAITDAPPAPAVAQVSSDSRSSSSSSSSSSDADVPPGPTAPAGDTTPLTAVAPTVDVASLTADDIQRHLHWVGLNDQVGDLVAEN